MRKVIIFPAQIYVSREKPPGPSLNRFEGFITEIVPSEFLIRFRVKVGGKTLLAELDPNLFTDMGLKVGSKVFLIMKLKWIKIL